MNADDAIEQAIAALTPDDKADLWEHYKATPPALLVRHGMYGYPYKVGFGEWLEELVEAMLRLAERRMAQPHKRREL